MKFSKQSSKSNAVIKSNAAIASKKCRAANGGRVVSLGEDFAGLGTGSLALRELGVHPLVAKV